MSVSVGDITGRIVYTDKGTPVILQFVKNLQASSKQIKDLGRNLSDLGQALTTRLTLPILALGTGVIKTASDFESSFAGVRKTVNATEAEFKQLEAQIRSLAAGPDAIPIDVNKLNAVAEAAGQLGIAKQDIVAFTRTMADLGQTTNLTADEAATATAQFQNIFGTAGKEVDRFGSTLVALGNAGASTEKDIISMGLRIAGAGVQLGLSQGQVLAYASSLSSMGIEAEAGGSAISKVMIDIALAVSKGGKELTNFASVSGMTSAQFKLAFQQDAAGAVASFIEGLGRMKVVGQDVLGTLDAMGITEIRMRDALLRASGAGDLLRDSLNLQAEAWRDNNALTTEAEKRYQTFESQLQLFLNRIKDISITFGTALLPVLLDTLDALDPWIETLKSIAEGFANTSPGFKAFVVSIAAITAAIGPALFVTGQLLLAWSQIVAHAPAIVTALNSVALATKGIAVVGVLLFINELIKAWGRASDAVTQYNLEVAKIEGNALAFAQQVSQGTLFRTVTQATFDQKIKEADILAGHIVRVHKEVEGLNRAIKEGAGDQAYLARQKLPEKEQELKNLWAAHNKLRTALAEVTVAGEKADVAFNPSAFAGLAKDADKSVDVIGDLIKQIERAAGAVELLRAGEDISSIEALVSAAETLDKGSLFNGTVEQVGALIEKLDRLTSAFDLAVEARDRLADAGDNLDKLIGEQFAELTIDPQMDALIANLRAQEQLVDSVATGEERRLRAVGEALALGIEGEALQRILLANADQWNVELSETQLLFNEIYERLGFIAEDIAFDLVDNWRRAWEENESITAATVESLRDTLLDVLQDIISQWLSQWFRAMAAWLARWIATQRIAQAASAQTAAVSGASGAGGGLGSLFGMGQVASQGGGVSANTLAGWGLAAFALYVVYKGFIEDHERKFARVTISNGAIGTIESHGKKYLEGIQNAAESIVANLTKFLSDIDVEMERLGTVIIESSKAGWNVAIPGSAGKLFSSMEEAISYAQVLMLKYGEFAESVTLLVRSVIASTKAISIEQLASDIAFARDLETQNLEQSAAAIRSAMDLAISQWKRAEDLFLSFYDRNLPAFAEAALSILTRLSNSIWAQYNQLAGIEEDPAKAWERKKSQYRVERQMVEAQLKLWRIEIEQRIANLKAGGAYLGGLGAVTRGTLGFAAAMVQAAEILDPALQELEGILALINQTLADLPPVELPASDPSKGKGKGKSGGGRNRQELREDLRDEVGRLEAEALGPLHGALYDLGQNISDFKDRAKEAKLPAAEIARGVELLTEAFQRSVQQQARDYAGLENEFTRRLREIEAFFAELQSLGAASGLTPEQIEALGGQALANLGTELSALINNFAGLVDPMAAINTKADELRAGVLAFAEAAGWSAEQIEEAIGTIEQGIEFQRQQGINSVLGNLFSMLKQFELFQEDALEFERQNSLLQLQIIEAQLRFYNALNEAAQEWIEGAREFINSDRFGAPPENSRTPVRVKVVDSDERDMFSDLFDSIRDAIDDWRSTIQDFVQATEELLTDEQLTGLTQQEQLDFARQRVEELVAKAKTGDLEALKLLDSARREFLKELRESEGGGFGFDVGFEWIMKETAELLKNAQQGEADLIAKMLKDVSVPLWRLPDLLEGLDTTFYDQTNAIINAIYEAIGGVPSFATGGIVMSGPRLVRVAEYVPEAIVPLDRLMTAIPYTAPMQSDRHGIVQSDRWSSPESAMFSRDALARLSALESSNDRIAKSLESIKADIGSAVRRQ